ncbi:glycosyltransferase family 4 protein [Halpernia sp. GG3]
MLKDIFPQNAVDMKMMLKNGLIYRFFRSKEKKLYKVSETIGCMSEANRQYVLHHNSTIDPKKVEVNPNSIEPVPFVELSNEEKENIRLKNNLPVDKKIFIYGGNLGIPQGLDFLLETIETSKENAKIFFLIVGSGTEFEKIRNWFNKKQPQNAKLISGLPKKEYDDLMKACDIGMIFLDKNFTIPNFPSRLLSYLEFKLPVLVAADPNTDIGTEVENYNCGLSVLAGNLAEMNNAINNFCSLNDEEFEKFRKNARKYLDENFLVSDSYKKIMNKFF